MTTHSVADLAQVVGELRGVTQSLQRQLEQQHKDMMGLLSNQQTVMQRQDQRLKDIEHAHTRAKTIARTIGGIAALVGLERLAHWLGWLPPTSG